MKKVILIMAVFLLCLAFASAESVKIGGEKVVYDEIIEGDSDFDGVNDRTSYYLEDELVFSAYDTDGDGEQDMWFTYVEGSYPETAMRDTTGDGRPENVITLDKEGDIVKEEEKNNQLQFIILGALLIFGILVYFILKRKKPKRVRKDKIEPIKSKEKKERKPKNYDKKIRLHVEKAKKQVKKITDKTKNYQIKTKVKKAHKNFKVKAKKAPSTIKKQVKKGASDVKYFYNTEGKKILKEIHEESKKTYHELKTEAKKVHKDVKKGIQKRTKK